MQLCEFYTNSQYRTYEKSKQFTTFAAAFPAVLRTSRIMDGHKARNNC